MGLSNTGTLTCAVFCWCTQALGTGPRTPFLRFSQPATAYATGGRLGFWDGSYRPAGHCFVVSKGRTI